MLFNMKMFEGFCLILKTKYIVADDSSEETTKCAGCMNLIDDDEFFSALGQDWHTDCFR